MKIEGWLFAGAAAIYLFLMGIYWTLAHELIGTLCLALTGGLALLIGFYILYTGKRVGTRPEDREDGEIWEADPDYGFFSPHSWWPLACAASAAIAFLGIAFGTWIIALGFGMAMIAVCGFVFEYYVGPDLT